MEDAYLLDLMTEKGSIYHPSLFRVNWKNRQCRCNLTLNRRNKENCRQFYFRSTTYVTDGTIWVVQTVLQKYQKLIMTSKAFFFCETNQFTANSLCHEHLVQNCPKFIINQDYSRQLSRKYVWYFIFPWVKSPDVTAFCRILMLFNLQFILLWGW